VRISDLRSPIFDFDFDFWTIFRSFFGIGIFVRLGAHAMLTRRRPSPTDHHQPTDRRTDDDQQTLKPAGSRQPAAGSLRSSVRRFVGSSVRRFVGSSVRRVRRFVCCSSFAGCVAAAGRKQPRLRKSKDERMYGICCVHHNQPSASN